jgi:hypothetical protein
MEKKESRSLLEKVTDVATIISAFGILVAIAQMLSQNNQFNDSFELSNKQFQYQLKQDSLQDKADSIKDYRDSVKLQLAISEFDENKRNQKEEAKRNEFQFEKNIQTLQELVRTNKQSNDYVVNSQKPLLNLEYRTMTLENDSIKFEIRFRNIGLRQSLQKKRCLALIDIDGKILFSEVRYFTSIPFGKDETYIPLHAKLLLSDKRELQYKVFLIIEIDYIDEFTKQNIHQEFYRYTPDLRLKKLDRMVDCDDELILALKKIIKTGSLFAK